MLDEANKFQRLLRDYLETRPADLGALALKEVSDGECTDNEQLTMLNAQLCIEHSAFSARSRMASPTVVTDETFEAQVLKSNQPTLVDFWAIWCGPCKMVAPVVDEWRARTTARLKVMKLDVDENQDTAMQYGVMSIPTLILFKDGQPVERIVGFKPKADLAKKILPHLG